MGMYTELVLSTCIKDDKTAIDVLKFMLGDTTEMPALSSHPLFAAPRWRSMLTCSSYYFAPRSMHLLQYDEIGKNWVFISRSDFKNYDREIEHFIDWITPYLDVESGQMFGYSRYEESHDPTIYYGRVKQR